MTLLLGVVVLVCAYALASSRTIKAEELEVRRDRGQGLEETGEQQLDNEIVRY